MKIVLLHISNSDKHFASAIQEYEKRLSKIVSLHTIKPAKKGNAKQIIATDTDKIIKTLISKYKKRKKILLSKDGDSYSSREIANAFVNKNIVLIIGGAYGLDEEKLAKHISNRISMGNITLPHGLCKLIALEQVYRAYTIQIGKKYHY